MLGKLPGICYTMVATVSLLLVLSGCGSLYKPRPGGMSDRANGAPEYNQGFDDGCESGLSTMVQGYYKSFYAFKQNYAMVNNPLYYQAWKDGYTYCRQYSFTYTWTPWDRTNNLFMDNPICVLCPNELGR